MLGRTHELGGVVSLLALDALYTPHATTQTVFLSVLAVLIGALSPDLDKPTSMIYNKIPAGHFLGKIIHPIFLGGHRHISHSLIGLGLFGYLSHYLVFMYLNYPKLSMEIIWISYMIGLLSHLLLDALTTEGIPLFFPLPYKIGFPPFSRLRIKTGGIIEHIIVVPVLLLAIVVFILHNISG